MSDLGPVPALLTSAFDCRTLVEHSLFTYWSTHGGGATRARGLRVQQHKLATQRACHSSSVLTLKNKMGIFGIWSSISIKIAKHFQ